MIRLSTVLGGLFLVHSAVFAASLEVGSEVRDALIKRASVWEDPGSVADYDLEAGPGGKNAFAFNQAFGCRFHEKSSRKALDSGVTRKFWCDYERPEQKDGEAKVKVSTRKVKYGIDNGEVYGEIAASRLLWALGFHVDDYYPVVTTCDNCPERPWKYIKAGRNLLRHCAGRGPLDHRTEVECLKWERYVENADKRRSSIVFTNSLVENKHDGTAVNIAGRGKTGWSYDDDLHKIDTPEKQVQIEALKIITAFVQHGDNKATQQRLVCPDKESKKLAKQLKKAKTEEEKTRIRNIIESKMTAGEVCAAPRMVVQDLGYTFGRPLFGDKMKLGPWERRCLWSNTDPDNLRISLTSLLNGSFRGSRRVSADAARFLANLMNQLTDRQIEDLYSAARVANKGDRVADWAAAFKKKRTQLTQLACD